MKAHAYVAAAFLAASAITGAHAANTCSAYPLICPTTMPIGGYCECTAAGNTHAGTVAPTPPPDHRYNSGAGGCGAHPEDPGCRYSPPQAPG